MKRVQSKLLALLLALVLAFSLAVPAFAAPVDGVEMEGTLCRTGNFLLSLFNASG